MKECQKKFSIILLKVNVCFFFIKLFVVQERRQVKGMAVGTSEENYM